jgi:hypothetical protein
VEGPPVQHQESGLALRPVCGRSNKEGLLLGGVTTGANILSYLQLYHNVEFALFNVIKII